MKIDIKEQFELLLRAPIVEAVVQVLARPGISWDEKEISAILTPKLLEFETSFSRQNLKHEVTLDATGHPKVSEGNFGWDGLVGKSKDQSVHFAHDGFLFSKLHPYQSWEQFSGNAMRFWKIFQEVARPAAMQRIGLRFINKIQLPPKENEFEKYIQPYPKPPSDLELPFLSYFHQDTLAVPGHPYAINIIRTVQPPANPQSDGLGLIVDIDAYTTQALEIEEGVLENRLAELRWLKNKAFFGSVTEETLKLYR